MALKTRTKELGTSSSLQICFSREMVKDEEKGVHRQTLISSPFLDTVSINR